jgi:hypothetical protein
MPSSDRSESTTARSSSSSLSRRCSSTRHLRRHSSARRATAELLGTAPAAAAARTPWVSSGRRSDLGGFYFGWVGGWWSAVGGPGADCTARRESHGSNGKAQAGPTTTPPPTAGAAAAADNFFWPPTQQPTERERERSKRGRGGASVEHAQVGHVVIGEQPVQQGRQRELRLGLGLLLLLQPSNQRPRVRQQPAVGFQSVPVMKSRVLVRAG